MAADGDFIKAVVVGISAGVTSLSAVPLLFRGKIRFERELDEIVQNNRSRLDDLERNYAARLLLAEEQSERQERTIERLETELREQYRANAEQSREVLKAVSWLQSLAGLATRERRETARE